MLGLIFFVVMIVFIVKYNKIKDQYDEMVKKGNKSDAKTNLSFCPNCGTDLRKFSESVNCDNRPNAPNKVNLNEEVHIPIVEEKPKKKESTLTKEEQKNNVILITGAFLIVLSAIIFLMTTWTSTGNITKTITIFLMLITFFAISRISLVKFNLKQTSQVFLYITLCYVPISLFSIALFGLFGEYLSIYGAGCYIYFTMSSLLVSSIYLYMYKTSLKTPFLRVLLELFLFASVIFGSLILTTNKQIIAIFVTIYIIIRELITSYKDEINDTDKILYSIYNIF